MLDPIPTFLAKECVPTLLPLITRIVNSYLASGIVPHQVNQAVVTPLLKKPGLDRHSLKHFRPVSNLPFISKILEKKSCFSSTPETPLTKQSHRKSAVRFQQEP